MPHRDFELPPAEVREGLTPGTASGAVFGTAFGAPTGAEATGAAADALVGRALAGDREGVRRGGMIGCDCAEHCNGAELCRGNIQQPQNELTKQYYRGEFT